MRLLASIILVAATPGLARGQTPESAAADEAPASVAADEAPAPAPAPVAEGPAPGPSPELGLWEKKERRIKIHMGLSWGFTGAGLVGIAGTTGAAFTGRLSPIAWIFLSGLFGVVTLASLIPAGIHTGRLVHHRRNRPVAEFDPGGLTLRF